MELEHGTFKGLSLTHRIGQQPQGIKPLGLLQGLLEIQGTLLKRPHGQPRLCGLAQPAGGAGHVLDPLQFRLLPQHPAQVVLLLLGQLGQLPHQGGHGPRREKVLGRALADFLRQQGAGGRGELITEPPHLLAGDLLALIGGLADHLLDLRVGLGGFQKGPLGEVVHAGLFQHPLSHQAVGGIRQLNQGVGAGLADFTLPQPLQKPRTPALSTALFPVAHGPKNPPAPDFGLQVEAIANGPGLLQPGQELHRADGVTVRIGQLQAEGGCLEKIQRHLRAPRQRSSDRAMAPSDES